MTRSPQKVCSGKQGLHPSIKRGGAVTRSSRHWALAFAVLLAIGCAHSQKAQLERVAKDWCLVIRASQVIPVYPLTEDLQPGDIFLVQTPIEKQAGLYMEKGFLSLDQLLVRIQPSGYRGFYLNAYGIGENTNTPHHWQFPEGEEQSTQWEYAPRAAFPSYTFSVKRGAGINLALPVQGVPVALNLLGADSAKGTITIADAYSYGVGVQSLNAQVDVWARENRDFLSKFAADTKDAEIRFIRVVARVYLTGTVDISLFTDSAFGGEVAAGSRRPVDLLNVSGPTALENYEKVIEVLNKSLESAIPNLPGGALKVGAASSRSVTLVETFPRPLVIGYLGFDRAILKGGVLGPPIPTQAQLTKTPVILSQRFISTDQMSLQELIDRVMSEPEEKREIMFEEAARLLPKEFQDYFDQTVETGADPGTAFLAAKNRYLVDELVEGPKHDRIIQALKQIVR